MRARILIGADGYFSKVRAQMLDDGPPDFTGSVMWRARFPLRQNFSTDRSRLGRSLIALQQSGSHLTAVTFTILPFSQQRVTY